MIYILFKLNNRQIFYHSKPQFSSKATFLKNDVINLSQTT